jgi:hypothetical protein
MKPFFALQEVVSQTSKINKKIKSVGVQRAAALCRGSGRPRKTPAKTVTCTTALAVQICYAKLGKYNIGYM